MSDSTWNDPRITAYVLGELSGEDKAAFESDCQSHPELSAAVEEARGVTGQLQDLYSSETTPPLDPERRDAIVASEPVSVAKPESSWRVPTLALAAAAVLLLLVGVAPLLRDQDRTVVMDEPLQAPGVNQPGGRSETPWAAAEKDRVEFDETSEGEELQELTIESEFAATAVAQPPGVPAPTAEPAPSDSYDSLARGGKSKTTLRQQQPRESRLNREARAGTDANQSLDRLDGSAAKLPRAVKDEESYALGDDATPAPIPANKAKHSQVELRQADKESIAEGDTIVLRGSKRDVEAAKKSIEQLRKKTRASSPIAQSVNDEITRLSAAQPMPKTATEAVRPTRKAIGMEKHLQELRQYSVRSEDGGVARHLGRSTREAMPLLSKLPYATPAGKNFDEAFPEGRGPQSPGDQFEPITDNPFKRVSEEDPVSTFSVDVDTASYSKTRDFLMRANQLPRPDAVRIEELINYFDYDYKAPAADAEHPFNTHVEITECPWNSEHQLARIGLQGKTMTSDERPPCNLVFLIDTSGSMKSTNKLPLVIEGMKLLVDQLSKKDRVAITVYAGSAGLVLDSTQVKKAGKKEILNALTRLSAGGSTNGGAGIALAYQTARSNFITDGVNRVILCTDGDFNVGVTGTDALVRMVEEESKGGIFLSVLGFGIGNHNDAMLEKVSGRGNGNYAFIDTRNEAHKVLVDQTNGTLVTIAKDVKLQIEFNVKHVAQYRLIGYENRILGRQDFDDDKKDAGEIGAGHAVTALYELVPAGKEADASQPKVDPLKYQTERTPTEAADSDELMTLKLRYKEPDGNKSTLVEIPIANKVVDFEKASDDVRFAAAVAGFGMQLRNSQYAGSWTLSDVKKVAASAKGEDDYQLRGEFVELVNKASDLMGEQ